MTTNGLSRMIDIQLIGRGITDKRVLHAMKQVDRADFVPPDLRSHAYRDGPLPISRGQTISQPYIVALMSQLLQPDKTCTCLEIGSGSGYQTAILASLFKRVISVERISELLKMADDNLSKYHFDNIELVLGDGKDGYSKYEPYDRIMVTASPPELPPPLFAQLAEGGIMVIPIGTVSQQTLYTIKKVKGKAETTPVCGVIFVPLV